MTDAIQCPECGAGQDLGARCIQCGTALDAGGLAKIQRARTEPTIDLNSAATLAIDGSALPLGLGAARVDHAAATLAVASVLPTVAESRAPVVTGGAAVSSVPAALRVSGTGGATNATNAARELRRYKDGVVTTLSGETVSGVDGGIGRVVALPYSSTDVLGRLGGYDLVRELGRGGMGVVYEAYSRRLLRRCALKMMIAGEHASEIQILRFQNEARLAARLEHVNIVPIFDSGEDEGRFYFVMQFVPGMPLGEAMAAAQKDGTEDALRRVVAALAACAHALEYAHAQGVVHRDIKPDNIVVDAASMPHIMDFGIAKQVDEGEAGHVTAAGAIFGTPQYMAPEQANGEVQSVGPKSDVYALGATLYDLCAGRPPFRRDNILETLIDVVSMDEAPDVRGVAKTNVGWDVPLDLATIAHKALEKAANRRYESAGAMAADLDAFVGHRPISARPISAVERFQKLMRRNRTAFVVAVLVAVTLGLVIAGFGAVMVYNIERTGDSIRALSVEGAKEQAATLHRAIRVNMLQGRADVVRELVAELREDPAVQGIEVVRVDRTLAYTDLSTRKAVERRLADPDVMKMMLEKWPKMAPRVKALQTLGFANIDASDQPTLLPFRAERDQWQTMLDNNRTQVISEEIDGVPMLTVMEPIPNGKKCQVCHGEVGEGGAYGDNETRAVLVIRKSQAAVEARISENRMATGLAAGATGLALVLILGLVGRIFGLRLPRRSFGGK